MKCKLITLACTMAGSLMAAVGPFEFHKMKPGDLPGEYLSGFHGKGKPSTWKISEIEVPSELDPTKTYKRRVLAHAGKNADDAHYPVLLYQAKEYVDMKLTVRLRITGGKSVRAAGIALGAKDDKNFYLIALKPSSRKLYVTDVGNGEIRAGRVADMPLAKDGWYEITVNCRGRKIHWTVNGHSYPSMSAPKPITGKLGLWTRGDTACEISLFKAGKPESVAQLAVSDIAKTNKHVQAMQLMATPPGKKAPLILASTQLGEVGQAAPKPVDVRETLSEGTVFYSPGRDSIRVTMPVRDKDGAIIAAANIFLKNSILSSRDVQRARASAVALDLGKRIQDSRQLYE